MVHLKKMKRVTVAALSLLLIMTATPVFATEAATVKLTPSNASVKAGEEFTVKMSIADNPGFVAIQFTLGFDQESLRCDSVALGDLTDSMISAVNPKGKSGANVAAASTTASTGDGVIATFGFTAKKDCSDYKLTLINIFLTGLDKQTIDVKVIGGSSVSTSSEEQTEKDDPVIEDEPTGKTDDNQEEETTDDSTGEKPTDTTLYTDIATHWGRSWIEEASGRNLFKGNGDGTFNPDGNITRAQFVTVLYRMAGSPETAGETPFVDMGDQLEEFQKAVTWAYNHKFVNGVDDTHFAPEEPIQRQAAMTIIFRYSGGKSGTELMFASIYAGHFGDYSKIDSWATSAMNWAVYNEIISGDDQKNICPTDPATRAEIAKILVGYQNQTKQ